MSKSWSRFLMMGVLALPACQSNDVEEAEVSEIVKATSALTASSAITGSFCSISIEGRDEGAGLFKKKTFGGNGRTCATCHPAEGAFTLSPEAVQARFAVNPQDPLFSFDGSDDGKGNGVARILRDATFLITRPLPDHISIKRSDGTLDPSRSIVLPRAAPSLLNMGVESVLPSPTFMLDGRAADLHDQALGAVIDHYQPKHLPQPEQLDTIATFQTSAEFFSSHALAEFACGGPDPGLPEGTTDSERRGRDFFVPRPQPAPGSGEPEIFNCSSCHAGPLLNEVRFSPGPIPDGFRFSDNFVSTFRARPERLLNFKVTGFNGTVYTLTTADPGRLLQTNFQFGQQCTANSMGFVTCGGCMLCSNFVQFNPHLAGREENVCGVVPNRLFVALVNATKIQSLRGISRTAPYFHDHSARTLEEVMEHYVKCFELHFQRTERRLDGRLSEQDVQDIIAYMKLL